jgi:hypothetical protein
MLGEREELVGAVPEQGLPLQHHLLGHVMPLFLLSLSPVDVCPVREVLTSEPSIVHMWGETSTEEYQFTVETCKVFVLVDVRRI